MVKIRRGIGGLKDIGGLKRDKKIEKDDANSRIPNEKSVSITGVAIYSDEFVLFAPKSDGFQP